jgi:ribosomal protein S18 acetylase RimI-like enzyme
MTGDIVESNNQFIGAWTQFANGAEHGQIMELPGVTAMFSNVPVPFLNSLGLNAPIVDEPDLSGRVAAIASFGRTAGLPFFAAVCEGLIPPELRLAVPDRFAANGMVPFMNWLGMAAERLESPRRKNDEFIIRPVSTIETRYAVNELNSIAYDMPPELGREALAREQLWNRMFGSVGFIDDLPVATATAMIVDQRIYIALVATHPDYRRRGYAEACMRDAISRAAESTGLTRIVLHATEAGHPVYLRMGFRDVVSFTLYAPAH